MDFCDNCGREVEPAPWITRKIDWYHVTDGGIESHYNKGCVPKRPDLLDAVAECSERRQVVLV